MLIMVLQFRHHNKHKIFSINICVQEYRKYQCKEANYTLEKGTQWHSWLRHCVTSQKVAGSIPDGALEFFILIVLLATLWHWG